MNIFKINFQIIIIISSIFFIYSKNIGIYEEIEKSFNYCQSSSAKLSIDIMCETFQSINNSKIIECIDDLKRLKTEILESNEFIETKHNDKVVFILNGEYYQTNCSKIDKIYIPRIFEKCTKDIFLYFYNNGVKTFGFLSTFGIIKSSSIQTECTDQYSTVEIGNYQFIKYKNMIKVNNLKPIPGALKNKLDVKVEQKIADLMISSLNSKNPYMIALVCLSIFTFLTVVFLVSLMKTRKKKSLLNFLFRYVVFIKFFFLHVNF